jgi:hypothetical protein
VSNALSAGGTLAALLAGLTLGDRQLGRTNRRVLAGLGATLLLALVGYTLTSGEHPSAVVLLVPWGWLAWFGSQTPAFCAGVALIVSTFVGAEEGERPLTIRRHLGRRRLHRSPRRPYRRGAR